MYFAVQFPFADLREFLGYKGVATPKLSPPAEIGKDFIRTSGVLTQRCKGGIREWPGEDVYCGAALALRFPNHLGLAQLGTGSLKAKVVNAYRRFYSFGPVSRFEVTLQLDVEDADAKGVSGQEWSVLLTNLLRIPMHKRRTQGNHLITSASQSNRKPHIVKLIHASKILSEVYLAATTKRKIAPQDEQQPWWYCPGTPAVIIEVAQPSLITKALPYTRHVLDVPEASASIFHTWLIIDGQSCSTWLIATGQGGDPDATRRLRICLTRMHAERECLNRILCNIGIGPGCKLTLGENLDQLDQIAEYLEEALPTIQKGKRLGIEQISLFNAVHDAFEVAIPGKDATLQNLHWQLAERVKKYIDRAQEGRIAYILGGQMSTKIQIGNVSVVGDINVVTANQIVNSFNKVKGLDASSDLKDKLENLHVEVTRLAKELPPDAAENLAKDLNSLTTEAVSTKPRKKWYEMSAEGILEAAKFVGSMTEPVGKAVKAVLALLVAIAG